jgi:hypothetical protein
MTLVTNAALVLVGHTIPCNSLSMLSPEPCSWRGGHLWLVARGVVGLAGTSLTGHGQCHYLLLHLDKRRPSDPSLCTCSTVSTCLSF